MLLPVSSSVTGSGHNLVPYSTVEMTSDSYNLTFTGRLMFLLFQIFSSLPKTLDALPILIVHSLSQFPNLDILLPR